MALRWGDMFMRFLIALSCLLIVAATAREALANPMPCANSNVSVVGQTVSFGIFSSEHDALLVSSVLRVPTEQTASSWFEWGCEDPPRMECPSGGLSADGLVPYVSCPDDDSGYFEGVCGVDTCVPLGRWLYLVHLSTSNTCYYFVVLVATVDPACKVPTPDAPDVSDVALSRPDAIEVTDPSPDQTADAVGDNASTGCALAFRPTAGSLLAVLLGVFGALLSRRRSGRE